MRIFGGSGPNKGLYFRVLLIESPVEPSFQVVFELFRRKKTNWGVDITSNDVLLYASHVEIHGVAV